MSCENGHYDLDTRWRIAESLTKEVLQSGEDLFRWDLGLENRKYWAWIYDRTRTVERNPRNRLMCLLERASRVLNVTRSSGTRLSWTGLKMPLEVESGQFKDRHSLNWHCRHFEDLHQPGEFPCPGDESICGKVFTSRNKMSSHYSRYYNSRLPFGDFGKTFNLLLFQELQPK